VPLYNKQIRLNREAYQRPRIYFVTICCAQRLRVFQEQSRGQQVLAELLRCSLRFKFTLHAYCVMPDHLHLVAQGQALECDLLGFIDNFKQRAGFRYKQECGMPLWQSCYYDHILRAQDHVEDVACYVWWNPVRAGLCADPKEYALSGSQTLEWMGQRGEKAQWEPPWKKEAGEVDQDKTSVRG
jgi:putative transposase